MPRHHNDDDDGARHGHARHDGGDNDGARRTTQRTTWREGRVKMTHGTVTAITAAGEHDSDVDGVTQMANATASR